MAHPLFATIVIEVAADGETTTNEKTHLLRGNRSAQRTLHFPNLHFETLPQLKCHEVFIAPHRATQAVGNSRS
jgi:hypothetical protein